MSFASYGASDNAIRKHDWAGMAMPQTNHCLYKANKDSLFAVPCWQTLRLERESSINPLPRSLKTREEERWHRQKTHTTPQTHTRIHWATSCLHLIITRRYGHKVIGTNPPKIMNSDRIILLSHYACQSSLPDTCVPPLCQTLSNCWELKGWTRDPALRSV